MRKALVALQTAIVVIFAWTAYRIYFAEQVSIGDLVLNLAAILAAGLISANRNKDARH